MEFIERLSKKPGIKQLAYHVTNKRIALKELTVGYFAKAVMGFTIMFQI
jgi:hypothetical protein